MTFVREPPTGPAAPLLARRAMLAALGCAINRPAQAAARWSVNVGPQPGLLHVTNLTGTTLRLDRLVTVQILYLGAWQTVWTEMALDLECPPSAIADRRPGCVNVEPHETITPPPWLGFTCNGQCQFICRANAYHGEGPFRFVLRACDDDTQVVSDTFRMPREPR